MTGRAKFPAQYVLDKAYERIDGFDARMNEIRDGFIKRYLKTPIRVGFLFWKHDYYPTQAEAELRFPDWRNPFDHFPERPAILDLVRVAEAVLASPASDKSVWLEASDCRNLNIRMTSGASA